MLIFYLSMMDSPEDKSKFEQLYHRYSRLMFYIANEILHDRYLAEDAVHNAFIKIIKYLYKINDVSCHKTKGFMVIVVEGIAKDTYNKVKRENMYAFDEADTDLLDGMDMEEDLIRKMELEDIVATIEALPEIYKNVFILRYIHELSEKEIAKLLKISYSTVRKRLERARKKLESLLQGGEPQ